MTKTCARQGCNEEFVPRTVNQIYHDSECCKIATNEKLIRQYQERKERRAGKKFVCERCTTILSRYNNSKLCSSCANKRDTERTNSVLEVLGI